MSVMMMAADGRPSLCQRLGLPWRWVVVGATFLVYTVLFGILYSYNVLFIAFKEEFNSSVTITGWIGSISIGLTLLVAPVVNVLIERCGCRTVAVFGIVTAAGALIVTSFLTHLIAVLIVYGVVLGVAGGLVTVCAYDVVLLYFPAENSVRAMALILTGTSLGLLSFTPLMSFIISLHGWRVLLRIMGPLLLCVGLPCVLTFVEPSNSSRDCMSRDCNGDKKAIPQHYEEELAKDTKPTPDQSETSLSKSQNSFLSVKDTLQSFKYEDVSHATQKANRTADESKVYHQIKDLNGNARRGGYTNGLVGDHNTSRDPCSNGEMRREGKTHHMKTKSGQNMTWKILVSLTFPELWLISISTILNGIGDCFYLVNLINYMISIGFQEQTGVKVVSIMGLSNLAGKIVMSLAGEYIPFPRIFLLVISPVVSVGVMFVIMFTRNHIIMYCVAVVLGGVTITTTNTITFSLPMEFFGPERALETSAVVLFTYGLGYFLGSLVGQSIDNTGSYTSAIWAFIGMYTVSGLCVLMAPIYQRFFAPQRFVTFDLYRKKRLARQNGATFATKTTVCESDLKSTLIVCEQVTCL